MPTITKAHKIKLNPTPEQEAYFRKAAGVARFAFNWGLAEYNRRLEAKEKVNRFILKKEFNAIKKEQFPWVVEVSYSAMDGAFIDLERAFRNFFDKNKKGLLKSPKGWIPRKDKKPFGWPRFKSKHKSTPAFYQINTGIRLNGNSVKLPVIGIVDMYEPLRFDGRVLGGRISYRHGFWWLSVQVEIEHETPEQKPGVVGVDLGIKYLAVTSNGEIFDNPKPLETQLRKLRRLQRKLDRQSQKNDKGEMLPASEQSNNWYKTQAKIQKLHYRVKCTRDNASHHLTSKLASEYGLIGVEDLNIKGMLKNRRLSKAISDAALHEKRRQLEYKAGWNGGTVVPVSQWFASSKTCNNCGWVKADLTLQHRQWTCEECGEVNERDLNAAKNIRDEAVRLVCDTSPEGLHGDDKRLNGNQSVAAVVEEK